VAQGKACIAFQWIAASGGLLDPEQSTLGSTPEEIESKLGFATLPTQDTDFVPLGGMGMHISAYASDEAQAEALNFMKWFEQADVQKQWAAAGGVPSRTDALESSEFLDAGPFSQVYADSCPSTPASSTSRTPTSTRLSTGPRTPSKRWTTSPRSSKRCWTPVAAAGCDLNP